MNCHKRHLYFMRVYEMLKVHELTLMMSGFINGNAAFMHTAVIVFVKHQCTGTLLE